MIERQGRTLADLAELGLSFARKIEARVDAVQSVDEAQALALAFHRVSRSVRLCLALEVRLQRESLRVMDDDRVATARRTEVRKAQVRAAVSRAVYDETEGDDVEALLDELEERLDEEALYEDFADDPIEVCVARIRQGLGLPPEDVANDEAQPGPPLVVRSG